MIVTALIAAAMVATPQPEAFGVPVSDAELGLATPGLQVGVPVLPLEGRLVGIGAGPARDQMDVWWSENGMLLIAEAVRPIAGIPQSLDLGALRGGVLTLRYEVSLSAVTRP